MMENYYLVNPVAGWVAVCISKNACTTLKSRVLRDHGVDLSDVEEIHGRIGYDSSSSYLRKIGEPLDERLETFAVWRDPVERFKSVFKHYALGGVNGRPPEALPPDVDAWLDWAETELRKPVLEQDEHVRRQSDYYRPARDANAVVPIDQLDAWFEARGFGHLPRLHFRPARVDFTPSQAARVRRIYWKDYLLIGSSFPAWRERPLVGSMWPGGTLTPLAKLCILSFLHHGFRFRLHVCGDVEGLPEGAETGDAAAICDRPESLAPQSEEPVPADEALHDRFFAEHGGFWTGLDVACLDPGIFPGEERNKPAPEPRNCRAIRLPAAVDHIDRDSQAADLMRLHGCAPDHLKEAPPRPRPSPRILVGVCSCGLNKEKRSAVRATWASVDSPGISVLFFTGELPNGEEEDTVFLPVDDSYARLPAKVIAFLRHASEHFEFDWVFKCDDDTYVDVTRLAGLTADGIGLIGSEVTAKRGSPSGGAGYFLSRAMVGKLLEEQAVPDAGDEDVLIGMEAVRLGAVVCATRRLGENASRYPRPDNTVVTAHCCEPERLHAIHSVRFGQTALTVRVNHPRWQDELLLHEDGTFVRKSTGCLGKYRPDADGYLLQWFDWGEERIVPAADDDTAAAIPMFRCPMVRSITVELAGSTGRQMFQYAHGLALAKASGGDLKLVAGSGESCALGIFGLEPGPPPSGPLHRIEYSGNHQPGERILLDALEKSPCPDVIVAVDFRDERFFRPVAGEIRRVFQVVATDLDLPAGRTPVFVHVQKGDFPGHDGLCPLAYYLDAIRVMRSLVVSPLFLVVTDDPGWCGTRFTLIPDVRILPVVPVGAMFGVMAACRAFILSRNGCGWWGAWLAGKVPVIAPKSCHGDGDSGVSPESWISLPGSGLEPRPARPWRPVRLKGRRLISFSLFGTADLYCEGLLDNIRVAPEIYPGWQVVVFHDGTPPPAILELACSGGALVIKTSRGIAPEASRFLAAGFKGIDRVIFRDADSLPFEREAEAVREWIDSGLPFHAMRDHPSHSSTVLSGMWGCVGGALPDIAVHLRTFRWDGSYGQDQLFQEQHVWKPFSDRILIHDSHGAGPLGGPFPSPRKDRRFVGERLYRGRPVYDTWRMLRDLPAE